MWPILLKVLSIIGIVIGSIIGLVLLLVLICLLCPIVYKISGSAHDGKYFAKVRIRYLFGLVRAGYTYPEPGNIYAKVAWFTLYDSKAEAKVSEPDDFEEGLSDSDDIEEDFVNKGDDLKEDANEEEKESVISEDIKEDNAAGSAEDTNQRKKKDSNKKKILNPIYHIKKAWENFRFKVVQKIQLIYKEFSFYKKLLFHDDTKALISKFKKQLIRILKQMIPKSGRADFTIGMDSPDVTAYIYGIYSLVFLKKAKRYVLTPDFEKKIIEGEGFVKGFFNLFGIVVCALPIIFSKKLRLTKARLEKHGDNMDIARRKAQKKHDKILRELEEEYSA